MQLLNVCSVFFCQWQCGNRKMCTQSDFAAKLLICVNNSVASQQRYVTLTIQQQQSSSCVLSLVAAVVGQKHINPFTEAINKILYGVLQIIVIKCLFSAVVNIYYHFTVLDFNFIISLRE